MRQGTYLNVILTVNAALLAALVWVSMGPDEASGQIATRGQRSNALRSDPFEGTPLVNAAEQRLRMIKLLEEINASTDQMSGLLAGGQAKVRVSNVSEIRGN